MKVTRFNYYLEKSFIPVLDALCDRCTNNKKKQDTVLIFEGKEGEGKTTCSVAVGYYVSEKTGRPFGASNVFFDIKKLMDFAQSTEKQIIVWDEPALMGLSTDSRNEILVNLKRLLMTARKKRHFFMINITYFNRFDSYLIGERPNGMVCIYTNQKTSKTKFVYLKQKYLLALWQDWQKKKQKNQYKYGCKNIRGTFGDVLNPDYASNVLSEFDIEDYEARKDKGIREIGSKSKALGYQRQLIIFRYRLAKYDQMNTAQKAELMEKSTASINNWGRFHEKYDFLNKIELKQPKLGKSPRMLCKKCKKAIKMARLHGNSRVLKVLIEKNSQTHDNTVESEDDDDNNDKV